MTALTIRTITQVNKDKKTKENFGEHHFYNILGLSDVVPKFISVTSETMGDCYL